MNKPDQLWAERFFRECLSQLKQGQWTFELTLRELGDGSSYGECGTNTGRQHAVVTIHHRLHENVEELTNTLAHEAIEIAGADLSNYLSAVLQDSCAAYAADLVHKIIEPCAAILAKAVHAEVNSD